MIKVKENILFVLQRYQIVVWLVCLLISCESDSNKNLIDEVNDENIEVDLEKEDRFNSLYADGYQKIQLGKIDSALVILNEAYLLKQNDPHLNYALGFVYSGLGKDSVAIFFYTETIKVKENHSGAYFSRGVSYHLLNKDSLAIIDYSKSINLNPNFRDVYFNRAQSYLILNKIDSACNDFYKGSIMGDPNCNMFLGKYCGN